MAHTVLVVEDEQDLREMMREALELSGYSVITASNGQEALAKLASINQLCLVILDLLMPVMNGWECFEQIRRRPQFSSVPVVVHSSAAENAPAGATRVLKKPIGFERLLSVVREYCG